MLTTRIIDFSNPRQVRFETEEPKRMIYAAGDAFGGPNKHNTSKTNIQAYTELGYNIFCYCCPPLDETNQNILYLNAHPELNILVCLLTGDNAIDFPILQSIFNNSLDEINTDDPRFYPNSKTAFEMLKPGGICINVHQRFVIGQYKPFYPFDSGWGEPNLTTLAYENNRFSFRKSGIVYRDETDFSEFRKIQEQRNQNMANNLRRQNAVLWNNLNYRKTLKRRKRKSRKN